MRAAVLGAAAALLAQAAAADIRVIDSDDVVHLVGGEKVRGNVVAAGLKAVVVVVEDKERVIPREQVEKIERGEVRPDAKEYMTDIVRGEKVITGVGFREAEKPAESGGEVKAEGAGKKPSGRKAAKAKPPRGGVPLSRLREAVDKNPDLKKLVDRVGRKKAEELYRKHGNDPRVRRLVEELLRTGKLPKGLPLDLLK
jgi:hypothetical protein